MYGTLGDCLYQPYSGYSPYGYYDTNTVGTEQAIANDTYSPEILKTGDNVWNAINNINMELNILSKNLTKQDDWNRVADEKFRRLGQ